MHLLFVYGEHHLHRFLSASLQEAGYMVHGARGEGEAFNILRQTHIDLVLLDLPLPNIENISLCTALRTHSQIPIIIMSAHYTADDIVLSFSQGVDDFIPKPFQLRDIKARIQQILRRTQPIPHTN